VSLRPGPETIGGRWTVTRAGRTLTVSKSTRQIAKEVVLSVFTWAICFIGIGIAALLLYGALQGLDRHVAAVVATASLPLMVALLAWHMHGRQRVGRSKALCLDRERDAVWWKGKSIGPLSSLTGVVIATRALGTEYGPMYSFDLQLAFGSGRLLTIDGATNALLRIETPPWIIRLGDVLADFAGVSLQHTDPEPILLSWAQTIGRIGRRRS